MWLLLRSFLLFFSTSVSFLQSTSVEHSRQSWATTLLPNVANYTKCANTICSCKIPNETRGQFMRSIPPLTTLLLLVLYLRTLLGSDTENGRPVMCVHTASTLYMLRLLHIYFLLFSNPCRTPPLRTLLPLTARRMRLELLATISPMTSNTP